MNRVVLIMLLLVSCSITKAQKKNFEKILLVDQTTQGRLNRWLEFYDVSLEDFKYTNGSTIPLEQDSSSIYFYDFEQKQKKYEPLIKEYSPNKKQYINLLTSTGGIFYYPETEEYFYIGVDDSQELYYIDLDSELNFFLRINGLNQLTNDVLWIDNDTFVMLTVNDYSEESSYSIDIYSISKENKKIEVEMYETLVRNQNKFGKNYSEDVILKERKIKIFNNE